MLVRARTMQDYPSLLCVFAINNLEESGPRSVPHISTKEAMGPRKQSRSSGTDIQAHPTLAQLWPPWTQSRKDKLSDL